MVRSGLRALLGLLLVLHGLANAVLPLRGVDSVGPGEWSLLSSMPYVVAILGFVASGLGVWGIVFFHRWTIQSAAIAGVCSLVGLASLGDADLWVGALLSAALPIATAEHEWHLQSVPQPMRTRWRRVGETLGIALLIWVGAATVLWPWNRRWGTTPAEWAMPLPGDKPERAPAMEILHGVTIDAPPSSVWPWLAQLGQDRAGFYSYDWLERLFGADIHNVHEIRPEWQTRSPGDMVPATQAHYLGGVFGDRPGWTVSLVEPNRALVLKNWGAFVLLPGEHGQTRFLIRSTISNERIPAWAAGLNLMAFELPHFIMQRRMMLSIKELAERSRDSALFIAAR